MSLNIDLYIKVVLGIIASVLLLSFLKPTLIVPLIKRAERHRQQEATQEYHKKLTEYLRGLKFNPPLPQPK